MHCGSATVGLSMCPQFHPRGKVRSEAAGLMQDSREARGACSGFRPSDEAQSAEGRGQRVYRTGKSRDLLVAFEQLCLYVPNG